MVSSLAMVRFFILMKSEDSLLSIALGTNLSFTLDRHILQLAGSFRLTKMTVLHLNIPRSDHKEFCLILIRSLFGSNDTCLRYYLFTSLA